ncbi:MAG: Xylulose kinase (EC [uncultured Paraburkholderia sp.]|nr:MAG: Xylulose kinase (EC [uncultured Paraburkholderia sp.]
MRPLYPCLIWMDRRATDQVEWVRGNVDLDRLYSITGNGVDSYYGYTKMLWLRDHEPEVWAQTRYFLPPNAYVIYMLTGEIAVDHSFAGNIGGIYDIAKRDWSDEALDMLGIPATMMPERLVESSEVVGGLLSQWTEQLGLAAGTAIVAGGVDAAVATFAAGVSRAGQHVAMIGTSMCWGYINQTVDARHGLISMPHVFNGQRDIYVFGGAITAGASVTWYRDQFCQAEIEAARATPHGDPHRLLEESAAKVPAGSDGVMFLPYLMGERSPVWDAKASGAFVGLSLFHTRAHLYRAVLEGVSFALKHNIEAGR